MRALPGPRAWALSLAVAAGTAAVLLAMGREPICECGYVKLWHGNIHSAENSQHLTDWYAPSHVLHGLVFYLALHLALPRSSLGTRLVLATLVEVAWEIAENTEAAIERYRTATISLGYAGDSVINSTMDIAMMWVGFLIAARAPAWFSVLLFAAAEAIATYAIRDGLILNVIMFVWPVEAIRAWQAGP